MRWRVKTTDQSPQIEVQNVYAHSVIRAAEIVAEVHGIVGNFLVNAEEGSKIPVRIMVAKEQSYIGKYNL